MLSTEIINSHENNLNINIWNTNNMKINDDVWAEQPEEVYWVHTGEQRGEDLKAHQQGTGSKLPLQWFWR